MVLPPDRRESFRSADGAYQRAERVCESRPRVRVPNRIYGHVRSLSGSARAAVVGLLYLAFGGGRFSSIAVCGEQIWGLALPLPLAGSTFLGTVVVPFLFPFFVPLFFIFTLSGALPFSSGFLVVWAGRRRRRAAEALANCTVLEGVRVECRESLT